MSELKEYIVTAKSYEVLDDLCNDIESSGGDLYIPNRIVEIANPRHVSRNTHYFLTDEEADILRKDPRVLDVSLPPNELGLFPEPFYIQTSSLWNKSSSNINSHINWGLLRSFEGTPRSNWGSNGTSSVSGTVNIDAEGRNVDVIILDGFINPDHPEYAVNTNGTGGSRVVQFNWYQYNPQVNGSPAGNYVYGPYTGTGTEANNNHGAHVAGTVAGNTQGWARSANIYNFYVYLTSVDIVQVFDYIKVWHRSKPINPNTGLRNPTIVNNSWGYSNSIPYSSITSINYRGSIITGPFTIGQLNSYGIYVNASNRALLTARNSAIDADIIDAINEGIIIVGAAGNNYQKSDVVGGSDYDNYAVYNGISYYYNRGSTPGASNKGICVGSVGALINESKSTFSNCGPRINIYAPGSNIMSSFNSTASFGGVADPRNPSYFLGKINGTSMSSPQVSGLLACILEIYPRMTQQEIIEYLTFYGKLNQMTETNGGPTDYTDLQGSVNRFLAWVKERKSEGNVYPKLNYKARPSSGSVFPRTKILRYGR
jgi:hypothetical protein